MKKMFRLPIVFPCWDYTNLDLLVYFSPAEFGYCQVCCEENKTAVQLGQKNNFKPCNWTVKEGKVRRQVCSVRKTCTFSHILSLFFSQVFHSVVPPFFLFRPAWLNTAADQLWYSTHLCKSWSDSSFEVCEKAFGGFSLQGYKAVVHDNSLETGFCQSPRLYCNSMQGGLRSVSTSLLLSINTKSLNWRAGLILPIAAISGFQIKWMIIREQGNEE